MPNKNLEVIFEIECDSKSVPLIVSKMAAHLDTHYRELGGGGLRPTDYVDDDIMGVEIQSKDGTDERKIAIHLLPRCEADDSVLLSLTQDYVHSDEFRGWLNHLYDENSDS